MLTNEVFSEIKEAIVDQLSYPYITESMRLALEKGIYRPKPSLETLKQIFEADSDYEEPDEEPDDYSEEPDATLDTKNYRDDPDALIRDLNDRAVDTTVRLINIREKEPKRYQEILQSLKSSDPELWKIVNSNLEGGRDSKPDVTHKDEIERHQQHTKNVSQLGAQLAKVRQSNPDNYIDLLGDLESSDRKTWRALKSQLGDEAKRLDDELAKLDVNNPQEAERVRQHTQNNDPILWNVYQGILNAAKDWNPGGRTTGIPPIMDPREVQAIIDDELERKGGDAWQRNKRKDIRGNPWAPKNIRDVHGDETLPSTGIPDPSEFPTTFAPGQSGVNPKGDNEWVSRYSSGETGTFPRDFVPDPTWTPTYAVRQVWQMPANKKDEPVLVPKKEVVLNSQDDYYQWIYYNRARGIDPSIDPYALKQLQRRATPRGDDLYSQAYAFFRGVNIPHSDAVRLAANLATHQGRDIPFSPLPDENEEGEQGGEGNTMFDLGSGNRSTNLSTKSLKSLEDQDAIPIDVTEQELAAIKAANADASEAEISQMLADLKKVKKGGKGAGTGGHNIKDVLPDVDPNEGNVTRDFAEWLFNQQDVPELVKKLFLATTRFTGADKYLPDYLDSIASEWFGDYYPRAVADPTASKIGDTFQIPQDDLKLMLGMEGGKSGKVVGKRAYYQARTDLHNIYQVWKKEEEDTKEGGISNVDRSLSSLGSLPVKDGPTALDLLFDDEELDAIIKYDPDRGILEALQVCRRRVDFCHQRLFSLKGILIDLAHELELLTRHSEKGRRREAKIRNKILPTVQHQVLACRALQSNALKKERDLRRNYEAQLQALDQADAANKKKSAAMSQQRANLQKTYSSIDELNQDIVNTKTQINNLDSSSPEYAKALQQLQDLERQRMDLDYNVQSIIDMINAAKRSA